MWLTLRAERVLDVARGRDAILCDRGQPTELVVKLSLEEVASLLVQITKEVVNAPSQYQCKQQRSTRAG